MARREGKKSRKSDGLANTTGLTDLEKEKVVRERARQKTPCERWRTKAGLIKIYGAEGLG